MRDVFALEPYTKIPRNESYVVSYPYLIEYFKSKSSFVAGDVVCGAHMVYGWMPTILELYSESGNSDLGVAAQTLSEAKAGRDLSEQQLKALAAIINNSLVGASKLLHFVAPEHFPIWDSKVYSFVHEQRPHHYRLNNVGNYLDYVKLLKHLCQKPEFPRFYDSVRKKLDYDVSPLRALELVMFLNAPKF